MLVFLIMTIGSFIIFRGSWDKFSLKIEDLEKQIDKYVKINFEQKISAPDPLIIEEKNPESFLTRIGVIQWTNFNRQKNGLPPLKENRGLNASAEAKIEDMFKNQYFAHDSPSGVGAGDLAKRSGYGFILIGENLALGDFKNDEALVEGWMNSPGHRANILNKNYTEIGVSVLRKEFEGRITWMAVQHFGLPLSFCPAENKNLVEKIDQNQKTISALENELNMMKQEIEILKRKDRALYIQKIEEYNNLVSQYNSLALETKILIEQYNFGIKAFNECISSVK